MVKIENGAWKYQPDEPPSDVDDPAEPDRRSLDRPRAGRARLASAIHGARDPPHPRRDDRLRRGPGTSRARRGVPALMALDFQQRAARLKALAAYLNERKEAALRDLAPHRRDARRQLGRHRGRHRHAVRLRLMGSAELPSAQRAARRARPRQLGKKGRFAGTHILVPRGGVAVHINAFNFPDLGPAREVRADLPRRRCPASPSRPRATSYLTEALVRMMFESGPAADRQPAARDRRHRRPARPARRRRRRHLHRLGRHRGQAARQRQPDRPVDPVQRRGRFAQLRDPRARRHARRRGVRPVRQGSRARDDRQGRARSAPRSGARSCRASTSTRWPSACASAWPRSSSATRRSRACAWARWPRRPSMRDVAERVGAARRAATRSSSAPATASRRWARARPTAPSSRRPCCCAATRIGQRRGARHRGLRPGQHADALRRRLDRRGAGAGRARQGQPGRDAGRRAIPHVAAQGGADGGRVAWPHARARPRGARPNPPATARRCRS